ncbi:MAG: quinone-dependent dihydroorotate dehydrogenase [Pseudomonadota bacterium]
MYNLIRKLLFCFEPERSHQLALAALAFFHRCRLIGLFNRKIPDCPRQVMGLNFANPVGLAAGLDKDAEHITALASLGFGFIEVGTVTPKPQDGHPKPRLFRLPSAQALINRMGFNGKGLAYVLKKISAYKGDTILGVNIGKNKVTPLDRAVDDYLICLEAVYPHADYVTINISSPNTQSLRDLQQAHYLDELLRTLKTRQNDLAQKHQRYVPLVVKLSPDLTEPEVIEIADILLRHHIDGVIVGNSTKARDGVAHLPQAREQGGLSGRPLLHQSTQVLKQLSMRLQSKIPIIGLGGIMSANDAMKKFVAGADLVQLYTGFIYQGPPLIADIVRACIDKGL